MEKSFETFLFLLSITTLARRVCIVCICLKIDDKATVRSGGGNFAPAIWPNFLCDYRPLQRSLNRLSVFVSTLYLHTKMLILLLISDTKSCCRFSGYFVYYPVNHWRQTKVVTKLSALVPIMDQRDSQGATLEITVLIPVNPRRAIFN